MTGTTSITLLRGLAPLHGRDADFAEKPVAKPRR
jgi:hypothetical protein